MVDTDEGDFDTSDDVIVVVVCAATAAASVTAPGSLKRPSTGSGSLRRPIAVVVEDGDTDDADCAGESYNATVVVIISYKEFSLPWRYLQND